MRKRRVVYFVLIIALVTSVSFSWYKIAQVERIPGLPPIAGSLKEGLDYVLPYDKAISARLDVTAEQAAKMSTPDLFYQVVLSHSWITGHLYNDRNLGIYRSSRRSPSLAELMRRDDMADGFIGGCEKVLNQKKNIWKHSEISLGILGLCEIALYPLVFEKFKGQEKQILAFACAQYSRMREKEGPIIGATTTAPFDLATKLAKRLDPNIIEVRAVKGDNGQSITKKMDEFMKSLERLYKG